MKLTVIDSILLTFFHDLQCYFLLAGRTFVRIFRRPFYYREFAIQFDKRSAQHRGLAAQWNPGRDGKACAWPLG